jgi:hypothetical protein
MEPASSRWTQRGDRVVPDDASGPAANLLCPCGETALVSVRPHPELSSRIRDPGLENCTHVPNPQDPRWSRTSRHRLGECLTS